MHASYKVITSPAAFENAFQWQVILHFLQLGQNYTVGNLLGEAQPTLYSALFDSHISEVELRRWKQNC